MSQYSRKRIAQNVEKYCKQKGLKREQLSLLLGFDNSYISKLECGNINITIDRLEKVADYLGVDVQDLLSREASS